MVWAAVIAVPPRHGRGCPWLLSGPSAAPPAHTGRCPAIVGRARLLQVGLPNAIIQQELSSTSLAGALVTQQDSPVNNRLD
ncbi:hypothetical protein L209DRAFT_753641 [Thermothelomyces heterothallicus CBS 203.75]